MKLKTTPKKFAMGFAAALFGGFGSAALLHVLGVKDLAVPIGLAISSTAAMAIAWYWIE